MRIVKLLVQYLYRQPSNRTEKKKRQTPCSCNRVLEKRGSVPAPARPQVTGNGTAQRPAGASASFPHA